MQDQAQNHAEEPKKNLVATGLVAAAVVAAAAFGLNKMVKSDSAVQPNGDEGEKQTNSNGQESNTSETVSVYKDGTYTATGSYISPGGPETVGITITLKDDTITAASAQVNATNPISVKMQTAFKNGFEAQVIGKPIASVSLDKVSGSSLTPKGFNDAIVAIKADAKK